MNMDIEFKVDVRGDELKTVLPMLNSAAHYFNVLEDDVREAVRIPDSLTADHFVNDCVCVACDRSNGSVVGVFVLEKYQTQSLYVTLNYLFVPSKYRRKGIGTQMVRKALEIVESADLLMDMFVISSNKDAQAFYRSLKLLDNPIGTVYKIF